VRPLVRRRIVGAAIALAVGEIPAQQAAPPTPPTLVVLIAVDQLRPDYFERYASQLTGGLGRLYRGGALFTNAHHDHAITETAPGHSVMLAGRFPAKTGIIANALGVEDTSVRLVGTRGSGASPFRFKGTTLADWLKAKDPRTRVLSVSRKDRGAILPIGRAREGVYWYASNGWFTTSTYYADSLPDWVKRFNARKTTHAYAGQVWSPLLPDSAYREPDSVKYENAGDDYLFPHAFPPDTFYTARLFPNYPVMDSLTAVFAIEGVNALGLGRGPQTDLLSVSFSTTDAVGHQFGPDSREMHDQILRLDKYLGIFLDSLFKLRDPSRVAIAFTADHGVAPFPELRAERGGGRAQRADVGQVIVKVWNTLRNARVDTTAIRIEDGLVTMDRRAVSRGGLRPDDLLDAIAAELKRLNGIARVDRPKDLARADTVRDAIARRWLHMLPADNNIELVFSLAPYAVYAWETQAPHGSPNDYDSHVPLLFYGPWFTPGTYSQFSRVVDLAPTLAAVIGVTPTEPLDGRPLTDALKKR
jgi:predicted AlkP superfamily pyrophosphatase or phosphodiesterase